METTMEHAESEQNLSAVLITLFKGVMYRDQNPPLWQALLNLQHRVRDHVAMLGLELMLDEVEGHAFLRQRPPAEDEPELPRLVARRQLGYPVSLLLVLLRKKLAEHDASSGDPRLILSREQIAELLRVFLPDSANEVRLLDRLDRDIKRVVELGFLRPLHGRDDQFELRRIIKHFVDAQWLAEFDQRLTEYREYLGGEES